MLERVFGSIGNDSNSLKQNRLDSEISSSGSPTIVQYSMYNFEFETSLSCRQNQFILYRIDVLYAWKWLQVIVKVHFQLPFIFSCGILSNFIATKMVAAQSNENVQTKLNTTYSQKYGRNYLFMWHSFVYWSWPEAVVRRIR